MANKTQNETNVEAELCAEITQLHNECLAAIRSTVAKACQLGAALTRLKQIKRRGTWEKYVEKNLPFDISSAQRYMKIFEEQDTLAAENPDWQKSMTMTEALKLLANAGAEKRKAQGKPPRAKPKASSKAKSKKAAEPRQSVDVTDEVATPESADADSLEEVGVEEQGGEASGAEQTVERLIVAIRSMQQQAEATDDVDKLTQLAEAAKSFEAEAKRLRVVCKERLGLTEAEEEDSEYNFEGEDESEEEDEPDEDQPDDGDDEEVDDDAEFESDEYGDEAEDDDAFETQLKRRGRSRSCR